MESNSADLVAALTPLRSQLAFLPERPSFLSVSGPSGALLIVAERTPDGVVGASLSHEALEALLAEAGHDLGAKGEQVRFELREVQPGRSGLVGKLMSGVEGAKTALDVTPLAERPLSQPFQEFQLRVMPQAGDPVASASAAQPRHLCSAAGGLLRHAGGGGGLHRARPLPARAAVAAEDRLRLAW